MRTQTLGYDREGLVVLPIFNMNRALIDRYETVKQAFLQHPNVLKAAASHLVLGQENSADQAEMESVKTGKTFKIPLHFIEPDFIDTYGIQLVSGRVFTLDQMDRAVILSRKAAQSLGLDDPVGTMVRFRGNTWEVVGMIEDFQNRSFHKPLGPVVMIPWKNYYRLTLRLGGGPLPETIEFLERPGSSSYPSGLSPISLWTTASSSNIGGN